MTSHLAEDGARYPSLSLCIAAALDRPSCGYWALQRFRWDYRGWTAGGLLPPR